MNPEQNRRQCVVCEESEPSFIHTVSENGVFRRLCTDCLLKEHRGLFCPLCLSVYVDIPPPHARIMCLKCPSITHLACSPSPFSSSTASCFSCPSCSDPNFSFFPKSRVPSSNRSGLSVQDASGTPLDIQSSKALVAAAKIAVVSLKNAAAYLKKEEVKKIFEAKLAKMKAKEALGNLQDLVRQKASENNIPSNKRKNDER